jgi:hypothetical protein
VAVKDARSAALQHEGHTLHVPHEQHETFIYWKHSWLSMVKHLAQPLKNRKRAGHEFREEAESQAINLPRHGVRCRELGHVCIFCRSV